MFSYRHAFHAGNHADVLKHCILVRLLRHLAQKDKPFWYIDTHAGAAVYALDEAHALKHSEFESGISRLWSRKDLPAALADYVAQVRAMNPGGSLRNYPGSPHIAMHLLRPDDRVRLFELHPTESRLLQDHYAGTAPRVLVSAGDGFAGMKAMLPPPPRRALVLIDPPYEDKGDYRRVIEALKDGLQRFATGLYAVWYPIVQRAESHRFPGMLRRITGKRWLHVTLAVKAPAADGFGLHGSGMFILNPPWTLEGTLREIMPYLVRVLGQDESAAFSLAVAGSHAGVKHR